MGRRLSKSKLESRLHAYAAGDLRGTEREEVEHLLQNDSAAQAAWDRIRNAHEALTMLRDRPDPPVSSEDAYAAIRRGILAEAPVRRPQLHLEGEGTRFYRRLSVAASFLLACAIGLLAWNRFGPEDRASIVTPPIEAGPSPATYSSDYVLNRLLEAGTGDGIDGDSFRSLLSNMGGAADDLMFTPSMVGVHPAAKPEEDR